MLHQRLKRLSPGTNDRDVVCAGFSGLGSAELLAHQYVTAVWRRTVRREARVAGAGKRNWGTARRPLVLVAIAILVGTAVDALTPTAVPGGVTAGLSALITVNAVVLALVYATTQRAVILSLRGEIARGFFEWVLYMSLLSMMGMLLGIIYLVWQPDDILLGPAVAFLVMAPGLVPWVAIQELLARRAGSTQAVRKQLERSVDGIRERHPPGRVGLLRVRPRDFEASPEDPFADDVLDRRRAVQAACRIVSDIAAPAIVVVDGGWGAGKTAFARMCVAFFRSESFQERGGVVVEFNAWTQSHTGRPLRDLVSVLTQEIRGDDALGEMLQEALESQEVKTATGGAIDPVLLSSLEAGSEATHFKDLLRAFVDSSGGRVVDFIDELDRCRPDHALEVLETARNILDAAGVVVVVTANLEALEHAVESLQGSGCDAETYLRRFIDLRIELPSPAGADLQRFYVRLLELTGLAERLKDKDRYTWHILRALIAVHPRSLRDLEQAVYRAAVLLASIEPATGDSAAIAKVREQAALTLLLLREADRAAYEDFIQGRIDGCAAGDALAKALPLGPPGSEMLDPATAQGPPIVPVMHVYQMEALLLAVSQDGSVAGRQQDLEPRYNGMGRPEDWPPIRNLLRRMWPHIREHELDVPEFADLIELAAYDP